MHFQQKKFKICDNSRSSNLTAHKLGTIRSNQVLNLFWDKAFTRRKKQKNTQAKKKLRIKLKRER